MISEAGILQEEFQVAGSEPVPKSAPKVQLPELRRPKHKVASSEEGSPAEIPSELAANVSPPSFRLCQGQADYSFACVCCRA